ncbi:unnamed protein product, partial [Effrenium voratum]
RGQTYFLPAQGHINQPVQRPRQRLYHRPGDKPMASQEEEVDEEESFKEEVDRLIRRHRNEKYAPELLPYDKEMVHNISEVLHFVAEALEEYRSNGQAKDLPHHYLRSTEAERLTLEVPEAVVEVSEAEAPAPVPVPADPACGEWQLLQPYLASSVEEVVLPGSVRSLAKGCAGAVFSCRLRDGEQAVMKRTFTKLIMSWMNDTHGSINQRWMIRESPVPGYFSLLSEAFPARALAATCDLRSAELREFSPLAPRQMWRLQEGQLISRHRECLARGLAIAGGSENQGAKLALARVRKEPHQRWHLRPSVAGAVLLESELNGLVTLGVNKHKADVDKLVGVSQCS